MVLARNTHFYDGETLACESGLPYVGLDGFLYNLVSASSFFMMVELDWFSNYVT